MAPTERRQETGCCNVIVSMKRLGKEWPVDEPRILVVGQSPGFVEALEPQLVSLLPKFRFQRLANPSDVLPELEAGGVVSSVALVQDLADEARVTAMLHDLQTKHFNIPIFVITAENDVYQRLRFLEKGAVDCSVWPADLSRLAALMDMLTVPHRLESRVSPARSAAASKSAPPRKSSRATEASHRVVAGFVFASRAMCELYHHLEAAAASDTHVLLTGETGTGKSHAARAIHDLSPRRTKPFVVVECGGLSATLLESELFGHVRGAFTGADRDHAGKFAVVEDGTILLDEIDCVPLEAQAKLLRVFEDRVYEPVGANRTAKFRARVIAATNRPLDRLVAEHKFRSDLFFRLNVLEFRLPPLRECREAILPLAEGFLTQCCQQAKRSIDGVEFPALDAMLAYDWPGNIRELRNCIKIGRASCRERV